MDELFPERLEKVIDEKTRDMSTNTDLDMREFLGIDKALTRIKGKLENNAGKLTEINAHITREHSKLAEIGGFLYLQIHEERVKAKIADLKEERSARLEIGSQNRKELASQFSRIRQTVEKIIDEDMSLREKLRLALREHGLTITAVLTSLGLVISTIISAIGGGSAGGSLTPPEIPNKVGEWVKNKIKARSSDRSSNFLKKVVTATAGHVWLFLTSITTLILARLMYPPDRKK